MATNAQFVTQLYQNILGRDPTTFELNSQVGRIEVGGVSQTQIATELLTGTQGLSAQAIIRTYVAAFGRYPDIAGLKVQENAVNAGGLTLTGLAGNFVGSAEFAAKFPSGTDATTYITALYTNVLGRAPDAAGLAVQVAAYNALPGTVAQKQAQFLLNFAQSAEFQATRNGEVQGVLAYIAVDNAVPTTAQAQALSQVPLATYIPLLNDGTSGNGIPAGVIINGVTLALTNGADIIGPSQATATLKTTAQNDLILADNTTLTAGDTINGGDGTDTLRFTALGADVVLTTLATLSSVENIEVAAGTATKLLTIDVSKATGIATITNKAASDLQVDNGTSAVNLVLDGTTGNTKWTSSAAAQTTNILVNSGTATKVDLLTGTTVNLTGTGAGTITTLTSDKATTLNIGGTASVTVGTLTANTVATINVTNSGATTISASDTAATVTVNGATATGAITFVAENAAKLTFTGGSGNDVLTIAAIADIASDTIDFGAGTADILNITGLTNLDSTGITGAQLTAIQAVKGIDGIGTGATGTKTLDASFFGSAFTNFRVTPDGTNSTVVTNLTTGKTVTVASSGTFATTKSLSLDGAATNTTGAVLALGGGITLKGDNTANGDTAVTVTTKLSDLTINSTGTTANVITSGDKAGAFAINNAAAITLKITGSKDLSIINDATNQNDGSQAFKTSVVVDASAFTGKLTIGASVDVDQFTGGSGVDTFVFDKLSSTDAKLDTITNFKAGAGGDIIDSVTAGAGNYTALNSTQATLVGSQVDILSAASQAAAAIGAGKYTVFAWNGSTYFFDNAGTAGYDNTTDVLVRLTGVNVADFVAANVL